MHKKIEKKAAEDLKKDASKYAKEARSSKGEKKKHADIEKREALSASKKISKIARKSHEY